MIHTSVLNPTVYQVVELSSRFPLLERWKVLVRDRMHADILTDKMDFAELRFYYCGQFLNCHPGIIWFISLLCVLILDTISITFCSIKWSHEEPWAMCFCTGGIECWEAWLHKPMLSRLMWTLLLWHCISSRIAESRGLREGPSTGHSWASISSAISLPHSLCPWALTPRS